MNKKYIYTMGLVLMACLLSSWITKTLVNYNARDVCGDVIFFNSYKSQINKFVHNSVIKEEDKLVDKNVPIELRNVGISVIFRKGRFVFFVLKNNGLLIDDATSVFFFDSERRSGAIEEIIKTTRYKTFHIQEVPGEPGWYFWKYMW